jgi:hypothetical protein
VNRNALQNVISKQNEFKTKDISNKTSKLRSKSVAKQMKKFEYEKIIEDMKLEKANNNNLSFNEIEKNHFKFKKELTLPPIVTGANSSINGSITAKVS